MVEYQSLSLQARWATCSHPFFNGELSRGGVRPRKILEGAGLENLGTHAEIASEVWERWW
jgi:hypothetical protein